MSRVPGGGETIVVRPTNNIYTVLAAIALVVNIIGFVALYFGAERLFGQGGLFG